MYHQPTRGIIMRFTILFTAAILASFTAYADHGYDANLVTQQSQAEGARQAESLGDTSYQQTQDVEQRANELANQPPASSYYHDNDPTGWDVQPRPIDHTPASCQYVGVGC